MASLDHLIRPAEEGWGDGEAEGLRRLQVDDQMEFRGMLHGKILKLTK